MCEYNNITNLIKFVNPLQEKIVLDNSKIILINGCAGSRKTDTIIKKGVYELINNKLNILFLTFVSSVSNEIRTRIENLLNINIPKISNSNHYLSDYNNNYVEISNIDAWIHKQLEFLQTQFKTQIQTQTQTQTQIPKNSNKILPKNNINFNEKVLILTKLSTQYNFYNPILKNNKYADVIIFDEFQDTIFIK